MAAVAEVDIAELGTHDFVTATLNIPPQPLLIAPAAPRITNQAADTNDTAREWDGILAPHVLGILASVKQALARYFGLSRLDAIVGQWLLHLMFLVDNANLIAYGKIFVWIFHPGHHASNRTNFPKVFIIRMLFLLARLLTVYMQYCIFFLAPSENFRNTFLYQIMDNAITDGIKYTGITVSILQATLLWNPKRLFERVLVNESRVYMHEIQFGFTLCAPVVAFSIEGSRALKFACWTYTIFFSIDFILKGSVPPKNCVRKRIAALAHEVWYHTSPPSKVGMLLRAQYTGFPFHTGHTDIRILAFFLIFICNVALRYFVYIPLTDEISKRIVARTLTRAVE